MTETVTPPLPVDGAEHPVVEALLAERVVSEADVRTALEWHGCAENGIALTLNLLGRLSDDDLAARVAAVSGLEVLRDINVVDEEFSSSFNRDFLKHHRVIPISRPNRFGVVNPLVEGLEAMLHFSVQCTPHISIVTHSAWKEWFSAAFKRDLSADDFVSAEMSEQTEALLDQNRDAPIVALVNQWLSDAAMRGASDIHFEVNGNAFEVRFRIDGTLQAIDTRPASIAGAVIARIKVIANLDLGERNRPQDGRTMIVVGGRRLDLRVSVIAAIHGEGAVIRILDRPKALLSLSGLGFDRATRAHLEGVARSKHGLFVVAGPTGSGKTTTLYAMLESLRGSGLKILSAEDPVEYTFEHVSQVQVSNKVDRTFGAVLRAFLRHDPDVIVVGEIRDRETAEIAVQAALTGHLVLASIHATDTSRVSARLIDLGVDPVQLEAALKGSMAQRLVRCLCEHCRVSREPTLSEIKQFQRHGLAVPDDVHDPIGCDRCFGSGYTGRRLISEQQVADSTEKKLEICALDLAADGQTSMEEALGLGES